MVTILVLHVYMMNIVRGRRLLQRNVYAMKPFCGHISRSAGSVVHHAMME